MLIMLFNYNPAHITEGTHRHGTGDKDLPHACRNAVIVHQEDDLVMYVGADQSGNPLEVGVVAEGKRFKIIHAMPAGAKYLR